MWVFCDLDGTLVDSLGALRSTYRDFLTAQGAVPSDAEFNALNGPALPEIIARLKATHGLAPSEAELLAVYQQTLTEVYRTQVGPCAGADRLLAELTRDGHRLALVTAAPLATAEAVLAARGWRSRFTVLACGDEVAHAKPAPDLYLLALERSGATPDQVVVIEDSRNGIRAAVAAGLSVIGVHGAPGDEPGEVAVVPDLAAALTRIRGRV
jgi:HAD superfamily hydrolase (TIGR01509 family)